MNKQRSVYSDYLAKLAYYSCKIDTGEVSHDDFADFQKLEGAITRAYQQGYFERQAYEGLNKIYYYLENGFRIVLRLPGAYPIRAKSIP